MKILLGLLLFFTFIFPSFTYAQTLIMGYRETARLPLIGKMGDNSGLYFDLFSTAAEKMNVNFKIYRYPKKRVLKYMEEGKIDFYPGFTFTHKRAKFSYYIENGLLDGGDIGLSLHSMEEIRDLKQLKGKKVLLALGGPMVDLLAHIDGIILNKVANLSIEKAIKLLRLKRHDIYLYNRKSIEYYLKVNNIKDIKLHLKCCGGKRPMYLGFSRTSINFKESLNPSFDKSKTISINNLPSVIHKESLAYELGITLKEMRESGEIQKILDKYYK
ncbi:MAG: transporter substrate-binding domain-containing protein [Campylobacteraceae bacterium]|nr:transporter substrate-binding domain-containing protein [Campylobacteraceae bacterium]